ncbi:MAG TPA: TolC family protein [Bryobacteraceae bacterium]|nr:TolC family protein [Bryobacteraceae bacterium]
MKRRLPSMIGLFPLLSTAASSLYAQPGQVLTSNRYFDAASGISIQKLVETALARNADLLATRRRIAEAQGLLNQSRLRPNPGLNVRVGNGSVLKSPGEREYTISYAHTFELGRKWNRRVEVAQLAEELATLEVADQERLLKASVKTRFGQALALVHNLEIAEQLLQLNEQGYRIAQVRVEKGEAAELEERLMRVEVNRVRSELMLLDNQVQRAILELKRLAGLGLDEPLKLSGRLDVPPVEISLAQAMEQALNKRPDLQAARLAEKLSEADLRLARAEGIPSLLVFLEYSHISSRFGPFGLNGSMQLVSIRDTDNTVAIGMSIAIPFRNRNQGNVQAAEARKSAASFRSRYAEQVVRQEVEAAYLRYETARGALGTFNRGVIQESLENLRVVRAAYQFGELRILDVLNEQRRFTDTQRSWIDLLREYYLALVELEKATGGSLF